MAWFAPERGKRRALGDPDPIEEAILREIIRRQYTTAIPPLITQREPPEHGYHSLPPNSRNHRTQPIYDNATPFHVARPLSSVFAASFIPNQPMENPAVYPHNTTGSVIRVPDPHILFPSNYPLLGSPPLQPSLNSVPFCTTVTTPPAPVRPAGPAFINNIVPLKEASTNNGPPSDPFNLLRHVASSTQHVPFFPANYSLQPDYRYSAITMNTRTGDPTNSCFDDPVLLPPGWNEEAAIFNRTDCDISNSTPLHTFQSSSDTGGTLKYVGDGQVPIAAAVPQVSPPACIDEMTSDLHLNPLANSHTLIVTEPTFHVELTMYPNRPVVPVMISGLSVVQQRRDVAAWLTLDVPTHNTKLWSYVRISRTPSVKIHKEDPAGAKVLYIDVVVSGATKHTEYTEACRNCKERRGAGPMIDFRSKYDIIEVTNGRVRLHFVFCCYPADRDEEPYYRVEVVLSERLADGQRRAIVRKQLPYYFDIYSRHMTEKISELE